MAGVFSMDDEQERKEEERLESQQTELMLRMTEIEQELNDCREQNDLLMTVLEKEKSLSKRYRSKSVNTNIQGYPSYSHRYRNEHLIQDEIVDEDDEPPERKPRRSFWTRAFSSDSSGPAGLPPTPPEHASEIVEELNHLLESKTAEAQVLRDEMKSMKKRSKSHTAKMNRFEHIIDELKQQQEKMQSDWAVTRRKYEKHIEYLTKQKDKLESKLTKQKKGKRSKKSNLDYSKEKELLELAFAEQIEKMKLKHELEMKKRELLKEESEKLRKIKQGKQGMSGGLKGFLYGNSLILVVLLFLYFIYLSVKSSPVRRNTGSRVYT